MTPLRMAVAGCGRIATLVHLPALRAHAGVHITDVIDASAEHRRSARSFAPDAAEHEEVFAWLAAQGAQRTTDAVLLALPFPLHARATHLAAAAGLHVYVEKPVATTDDDIALLSPLAAAPRTCIAVGFNYRWHPLARAAAVAIAEGRLGRIVAVQSRFVARPATIPPWKTQDDAGGALFDRAPHHVDLVAHLLGTRAAHVCAVRQDRRAAYDTAALTVEYADTTVHQLLVTYDAAEDDALTLIGERGQLHLDRLSGLTIDVSDGPATRRPLARSRRLLGALLREPFARRRLVRPATEPSFRDAVTAFVAAARAWPAPPPARLATLGDGLDASRALIAARAAARTGHRTPVAHAAPP